MRKSGIEALGDVPWGTHLCLFCEAGADLLEAAAAYLKAGLENDEMCVWVTSPDMSDAEALTALGRAVPGVEAYLRARRLQMVPHSQVYFTGNALDWEHTQRWWQEKLDEALQRGLEGLRVMGDTAWLERRDWERFADCERAASKAGDDRPVLTLCAYPLARCSISDVLDIMESHEAGIVKRQGAWHVIGNMAAHRRAVAQLRIAEERYRSTLDSMLEGCQVIGFDWRYLYVNEAVAQQGRRTKAELLGHTMMEMYPGMENTELFTVLRRCMEQRLSHRMENEFTFPDGTKGWFELSIQPVPQGIAIFSEDITQRKRVEEELRHHHVELSSLLEASRTVASSLDLDQVLKAILTNLRRVIPAAEVQSVALYDDKEEVLKTRLALGYEQEARPPISLRPGEGITGKAFQTEEAKLYTTPQEVGEAQANISPENWALFLQATGGRRPTSVIAVPLKSEDRTLGCMVLLSFGQRPFTIHEMELAQAFAHNAAIAIGNAKLHAEMEQRALTDGLTGLYNRGHLFERLREEIARHNRDRRPLCLAMLDVDNLKTYNDTYGHPAGDRALQAIARALGAAVRQSDIVFRYGGDELSIILVNTSGEAAKGVVDRIKDQVASQMTAWGLEAVSRLSAGVAVFVPVDEDETHLMEAADKALYQSKAKGGITVLCKGGGESNARH